MFGNWFSRCIANGGAGGAAPAPSAASLMVDAWLESIDARSATASQTVQDALLVLAQDLIEADLLDKIIYLNMRVGDQAEAARTPFIYTHGPGYDTINSGSITTWTQADGMNDTVVLGTGVTPSTSGISNVGASMGVYMLNDQASSGDPPMFGASSGASDEFRLYPNLFDLHVFDSFTSGDGRAQVPGITETRGMIIGSRDATGTARIMRNGTVLVTDSSNAGSAPTAAIAINFAKGVSGGDFIGLAMDADDMAAMTWIMHTFATSIGRAVVADGLF